MFQRFRCCECYRVQKSSLSQQVLSKIVAYGLSREVLDEQLKMFYNNWSL